MCLNRIAEQEFKLAGEGGGQSDTVEGTVKRVWAPSVTPHAFNRYGLCQQILYCAIEYTRYPEYGFEQEKPDPSTPQRPYCQVVPTPDRLSVRFWKGRI